MSNSRFALSFSNNDIDENGFIAEELDQFSTQARRYFLTTYYNSRKHIYLYVLLALFPTGLLGVHKFYINRFGEGLMRLKISMAVSVLYFFGFVFLYAGELPAFQFLTFAAAFLTGAVAIANLNDAYGAVNEIRIINKNIASRLIKLILSTDH